MHWGKKCERMVKASSSSSSFLGFPPSMPVPLCQQPSSAGTGVVTTTPSSSACAVTFPAAAPVVSAAPGHDTYRAWSLAALRGVSKGESKDVRHV